MFHNRPHLPTFPYQQHAHKNRGPVHNKGASETRKAIDHYSYAINDEIGRGFSSKVYKGRDEKTQELVAVKVIDMKMVKQSIHASLLKNEINALKQFNSKNIMRLLDVFQTQNNTYIITEFCDSGDLSNLIRRRGRLEEGEAVKILKAVVSALSEMNQKGFIHRDIKPANILLDKNTPKVADFGFAIPAHEAKLQGKSFNVGTPLYMSPQALRQQGHTEKGDVWAIGIMLFEMLFGRTPYNAQSEAALISNILHQPLKIPSSPPVSDMAKDFIRRCLVVDENRRLKIRDLINHQLLLSRSSTPVERVPQKQHFQEIQKIIIPTEPVYQPKFKRSQSQGVKEGYQREYKYQNNIQMEEKKKIHELNKKKLQEQIQRSASEKENLKPKMMQKVSAFDEPSQKFVSIEFKRNNEILFSQINFCRFLYKFSQSLAIYKQLNNEMRDKLLFLMGKNIAIKITKLASIIDKENNNYNNNKANILQLEDYENYKKSESYQKFSQAIQEYYDKYMRHYEKIMKLAYKNEFQKDSVLGILCSKDIFESESFYKIVQSHIRICINEIKQQLKQGISQHPEEILAQEYQLPTFLLQGIWGYLQLTQKIIENQSDLRTFAKQSQAELLIEKRSDTLTCGQLEQILIQVQ